MARNKSCNSAASYRAPMQVTTVRRFEFISHSTTFPVCPRCQQTLDREYQSFCNACGQALNWENFDQADVIAF